MPDHIVNAHREILSHGENKREVRDLNFVIDNQMGNEIESLRNHNISQAVVDKHFPDARKILGNKSEQESTTKFLDGASQSMSTTAASDGSVSYKAETRMASGAVDKYEGSLRDGVYTFDSRTTKPDKSESSYHLYSDGTSLSKIESEGGRSYQLKRFNAGGKETNSTEHERLADGQSIHTEMNSESKSITVFDAKQEALSQTIISAKGDCFIVTRAADGSWRHTDVIR